MKERKMKRGQPITFRVPSDTPDHILKQLQKLRDVEKRNFSSKIASYVIQGINESLTKQRETITIPLPKGLSKEQRDWLKHEHSEALLGSIVYQLLADPVRTASILAALNSDALEIDDALYLQEESLEAGRVELDAVDDKEGQSEAVLDFSTAGSDDLDNIDWEQIKVNQESAKEEEVEEPLADFLAQMNK